MSILSPFYSAFSFSYIWATRTFVAISLDTSLIAQLKGNGTGLIIAPTARFDGEAGEQRTISFHDPSGNALKLKTLRSEPIIFAH